MKRCSYLSKTIDAICQDLAAGHDSSPASCPVESRDDVTQFVLEQLEKMPFFLSRPILFATAVFGMSRLLLEGSPFHRRPKERRRLQVERWRCSKFGPKRDLIRLYTSLVVLAVYSRHEVAAKHRSDG